MANTKQITEAEVRKIAKEESEKIMKEAMNKMATDIARNTEILSRLERLLLGEAGMDEGDTIKARATFAWAYAKRNTDLKVIERAIPALDWFEDMNTPEKGCLESKLDILGKIITAFTSLKWVAGFFGVVSVSTFLGLIFLVYQFIKLVQELGM